MASSSLSSLPAEVLSQILSSFCDGKSISTFQIVARGDPSRRESHFALVQDALVHRYVKLANKLQHHGDEVKDVLDAIREDIRTAGPDDNDDDVDKVPEWCAILDYFDGLKQNSDWIVWCGPVGTAFGQVQAFVTTPLWTVGALQYWYHELELVQFSLVRPAYGPRIDPESIPYGRLEGLQERDSEILVRLRHTMSPDPVSGQFAVVPNHMEYDPTLCFTVPMDPSGQNDQLTLTGPLICHWDGSDGYGWEDSIDRLGENVIRIMSRYCDDGRQFALY